MAPLCIVCRQAIVLQHNRFRCIEEKGTELTKLGNILEDMAKHADIKLKTVMGPFSHTTVSYTHLTLPTIYSV